MIKEADPDIIGLQEVRSDASNIHNQILEIQELLPQYSWHVYHPVQQVSFMKGTYKKTWSHEGIGILSRYPLISSHVQNLTYNAGPDANRRVVLHASFLVQNEEVKTSLIHFSYVKQQQCENTIEVLKFLKAQNMEDVIMLGDFNTYNDFEDPIKTLTGQVSRCLKRPFGLPLRDAWPSVHQNDRGFTFSNMPVPGLESRPDRILLPTSYTAKSARLLGTGEVYKQRYSYHILWNRLSNAVSAAMDAKRGRVGRSCEYDCGPHASCRCGMCVSGGGDKNACALPDCEECSRSLLVLLFGTTLFYIFLAGLLIYAVLQVMHAMNKRGRLDLPQQLCCLLNPLLYTQFSSRRNTKCCISRLPPMLMVIICVLLLYLTTQVILYGFKDILDDIFAIIPEEYFPSDHRLLVVEFEKSK